MSIHFGAPMNWPNAKGVQPWRWTGPVMTRVSENIISEPEHFTKFVATTYSVVGSWHRSVPADDKTVCAATACYSFVRHQLSKDEQKYNWVVCSMQQYWKLCQPPIYRCLRNTWIHPTSWFYWPYFYLHKIVYWTLKPWILTKNTAPAAPVETSLVVSWSTPVGVPLLSLSHLRPQGHANMKRHTWGQHNIATNPTNCTSFNISNLQTFMTYWDHLRSPFSMKRIHNLSPTWC